MLFVWFKLQNIFEKNFLWLTGSLEQLNKGEARHSLCRNIFYGKNGRLHQTYFDGMEEQLNSLSLVTNAIIYWNTLYLEKVLEQMKKEGFNYSKELISKLSPLLFGPPPAFLKFYPLWPKKGYFGTIYKYKNMLYPFDISMFFTLFLKKIIIHLFHLILLNFLHNQVL